MAASCSALVARASAGATECQGVVGSSISRPPALRVSIIARVARPQAQETRTPLALEDFYRSQTRSRQVLPKIDQGQPNDTGRFWRGGFLELFARTRSGSCP